MNRDHKKFMQAPRHQAIIYEVSLSDISRGIWKDYFKKQRQSFSKVERNNSPSPNDSG